MTNLRNIPTEAVRIARRLAKKARALVAKKGGWRQGYYAAFVDKDGVIHSARSYKAEDKANCFCAVGAINRAEALLNIGHDSCLLQDLLAATTDARGFDDSRYPSIEDWNDAPLRTQSQVVRAFDRVIARLDRRLGL
jgi:hypothetical protein